MKEKDLLSSFLVGNELHDSISFTQFARFFPNAYKSHPETKDLYRAYLNARHQVRKKVQRNIDIEVRRNPFQFETQTGAGTAGGVSEEPQNDIIGADDMDIEDVDKHLTLDQAIQELTLAEKIYKKEIERLEQECSDFAQEFQNLDREMGSIQVPDRPVEGVDEEALMKDLEVSDDLIMRCDSIINSARA
ncbi:hypothetical protein BGX28_006209 [Mortierella sp. GBA30]|nr:hypothetical protein BGX28_006209 [Mortierella sp. GBA30]